MLPTLTINRTWMLLGLLLAVVPDMGALSPLQSVTCRRENSKRLVRPLISRGIQLRQSLIIDKSMWTIQYAML